VTPAATTTMFTAVLWVYFEVPISTAVRKTAAGIPAFSICMNDTDKYKKHVLPSHSTTEKRAPIGRTYFTYLKAYSPSSRLPCFVVLSCNLHAGVARSVLLSLGSSRGYCIDDCGLAD
jgi:hypothetical protein